MPDQFCVKCCDTGIRLDPVTQDSPEFCDCPIGQTKLKQVQTLGSMCPLCQGKGELQYGNKFIQCPHTKPSPRVPKP